ncbi:MAG: hypothetical protein VST69_05330 [Nitrospirota bacterium]|nr:hypothetical protein [Nitrospirota bacterium]
MDKNTLFKAIKKRDLGFEDAEIRELLGRMDGDYLSHCEASEVAMHIEMSQSLCPKKPLQVCLSEEGAGDFKIGVIAYDYFYAFSVICGLISSFGLNIEDGSVQTVSIGLGRKKILDLFRVRVLGKSCFNAEEQTCFRRVLAHLMALLEKGDFRGARANVNQKLVAYIARMAGSVSNDGLSFQGLLFPIEIHFENNRSPQWTVLDIYGKDTPAFLYAFSNALAMRNIYIHKIKITHEGDEIHDRLYIYKRHGKKIVKVSDQQALQVAAFLIKQFIHFLPLAPDPMMAMTHFDQFLDKILEMGQSRPLISFLQQQETLNLLARLFGTSNFLWEDFLRVRFDTLFPILARYKSQALATGQTQMRQAMQRRLRKVRAFEEKRKVLNDYKDEEMFRIDLRHLHEPRGRLKAFSEALSDLAEVIVTATYRICKTHLKERYGTPRLKNGKTVPFSIFGFGKLGGRELGYASDIELLFVYGDKGTTDGPEVIDAGFYFEKLSQEMTRFIDARQAGIFEVDTRLRPYGTSGAFATSFQQFKRYYSENGQAAPFERQALIKLRLIAGSRALGRLCEKARDNFVYSGAPWDMDVALDLRQQQMAELVPKGRVNVKYSQGGIVDIEYLTQYLQIKHGPEIKALRSVSTHKALRVLSKHQILSGTRGKALQKNYLFLRTLIDAMRMVRGNARDLLLPASDSEEFMFLARRMAYAKKDWRAGSMRLSGEIVMRMSEIHQEYQAFFDLSR